ncbi:MAG: hypothetical protein ACO1OD_03145 [Croceibacterium sp.]
MTSAYVKKLDRLVAEDRTTKTNPAEDTLQQRFLEWFNGLPEVSRQRAYSMVEMEQALHTQGKYLSPILLELGWQRRRKWSSSRQYHRFWVPPDCQ